MTKQKQINGKNYSRCFFYKMLLFRVKSNFPEVYNIEIPFKISFLSLISRKHINVNLKVIIFSISIVDVNQLCNDIFVCGNFVSLEI